MRRLLLHVTLGLILALGLALVVAGCSDSGGGSLKTNQPPTVWLSSAPPEGTTSKYTVHLYWGGWDPDGEISHYEYAITNNTGNTVNEADTTGDDNWHTVVANDSMFTFSADQLADTNTTSAVSEFVRSHTFFIRAVDEQGARSTEPAYRSFTARTLSPEVTILVPRQTGLNPALVPPITTFRWTAKDYVDDLLTQQDPDSVQYVLVSAAEGYQKTIDWLRHDPAAEAEWRDWVDYRAPEDGGKLYTSEPLDLGPYIFAVRAKDEAGAVTPTLDEARNVRRLRVSERSSGPVMTLNNQFLGTVTTTVCNTPIVIMDLPAGVPMHFCWSAAAESYGGLVSGYRYGWDISDLDDPDQWETDFTPFTTSQACSPPRTFFFGSHTFTAEVVDNSGFCSRIEVKVNIVQFTFSRSVVMIDDFTPDKNSTAGWNGSGQGILPNDMEHDAFWDDMLSEVADFDPASDVIEVSQGSEVPLTEIADYQNIVWNVYSDRATSQAQIQNLPLLYDFIQYRQKNPTGAGGSTGKRQPNLLALFMAAGGHVMITGRHPVSDVVNRSLAPGVRYPLIFLYEVEGEQEGSPDIDARLGDQSFGYKDLCVDVLDYSMLPTNARRSSSQYCPIGSMRGYNENLLRDHTMRAAYPLEPRYPALHLRPEAAGPGKAYEESKQGIDAEMYNPTYFFDNCIYTPSKSRDCFEPIYGLECLDTGEPTYHQPIAFWTSTYADRKPEASDDAVAARSVVFGFPLVYFNPDEVKDMLRLVLFDEWQLPRSP